MDYKFYVKSYVTVRTSLGISFGGYPVFYIYFFGFNQFDEQTDLYHIMLVFVIL